MSHLNLTYHEKGTEERGRQHRVVNEYVLSGVARMLGFCSMGRKWSDLSAEEKAIVRRITRRGRQQMRKPQKWYMSKVCDPTNFDY